MPLLLDDVTVLDLSRLLPGPFCTQLLADLGAQVIKVEDTRGGDYARHYPPLLAPGRSAFFDAINRGKKSVAIDLKSPQGLALCKELVKLADVLVESFRPGVMAKLGLDEDTLRELNPALIICAISGYGQRSPHHHKAGHDINYQALAGTLHDTHTPHGEPVIPGAQIADIAGGSLHAALGIVSALYRRSRTGEGHTLDISMTHGALAMHMGHHGNLRSDPDSPIHGMLTGSVPCYAVYATRCGGHMALGALEPKFWSAFTRHMDLEEYEFDGLALGERGERVREAVARAFMTRTRDEWAAHFAGLDVCCEPVLSPVEALEHALHESQQAFFCTQGITYTCSPLGTAPHTRAPSPAHGAHTQELLEGLCDEGEFSRLVAQGVLVVSRTDALDD